MITFRIPTQLGKQISIILVSESELERNTNPVVHVQSFPVNPDRDTVRIR